MAKANGKGNGEDEQLNLFPFDPEIKGFGLTAFKLKGAIIEIEAQATTLTADIAQLTPTRWAEAAAAWLVALCGGDCFRAHAAVLKAHDEFQAEQRARAADAAIGAARSGGAEPDDADGVGVAEAAATAATARKKWRGEDAPVSP